MLSLSNRIVSSCVAMVAMASFAGCQTGSARSDSAATSPRVKVDPSKVQARAAQPPPDSGGHGTQIGKGGLTMHTANTSDDRDIVWVENIDIDGDGVVERTEMLWDDEDRVLYAYAQTDVDCAFGGVAIANVLIGVNAAGNPRHREPGSGMYAAEFDESECGASDAGLYGCTFTAKGEVTSWVLVRLDEDNDSIQTADTFR